jgi:hypothetical protein
MPDAFNAASSPRLKSGASMPMLQRLDQAHDSKLFGVGPALAAGRQHFRAGDALEQGIGYSFPDSRYQSRAKQITRRLASNQSDAQRHELPNNAALGCAQRFQEDDKLGLRIA